jgi:hypothetical protein
MTTIILAFIVLALLAHHAYSAKEWRQERAELLQRIQAPEIAVYENAKEQREAPPKIGFENDGAFNAALDQRRMREADGGN